MSIVSGGEAGGVQDRQDVVLEVDLGRQPDHLVGELEQGYGPLAERIRSVVEQARAELGISPEAEAVPVVLLYRREEPGIRVFRPRRPASD